MEVLILSSMMTELNGGDKRTTIEIRPPLCVLREAFGSHKVLLEHFVVHTIAV